MNATILVGKRLRETRQKHGMCYLTHGDDDYDHRSLRKARRALSVALIQEGVAELEDAPEARPVAPKAISFRIVMTTQCMEDYGTRWKPKGGNEYHLNVGSADEVIAIGGKGLQALVDQHRSKFERRGDGYQEYLIDWALVPSNERTQEEEWDAEDWYGAGDVRPYLEERRKQREVNWLNREC